MGHEEFSWPIWLVTFVSSFFIQKVNGHLGQLVAHLASNFLLFSQQKLLAIWATLVAHLASNFFFIFLHTKS